MNKTIINTNIKLLNNKLSKITDIIIFCFNKSFNVKNGLLDLKNNKQKIELLETIDNILLANYGEESSRDLSIIYLLVALIIYKLNLNNFNNYHVNINDDITENLSLRDHINNFIINISKNCIDNFDINLIQFENEIYSNYSAHKIFYTIDNLIKIVKYKDHQKMNNINSDNLLELQLEIDELKAENNNIKNKLLLKYNINIYDLLNEYDDNYILGTIDIYDNTIKEDKS